jgi:hypothetical protein
MALTPVYKTSFAYGEIDPAVWGRADIAQWHAGCSVARNVFVNYRGGLSSRGGTAWVGPCRQPATAAPPRNVSFNFSTSQSYTLEFGDNYMRVVFEGGYVTETPLVIVAVLGTNPIEIEVPGNAWTAGNYVYLTGFPSNYGTMNNRFYIVESVAGNNVFLNTIFGTGAVAIVSGSYTSSSARAARIYEVATPYAAEDLRYLKYTQSADVMTLTLLNEATGVEYPPYDLARVSPTNWTFTETTFATKAVRPAAPTLVATNTTPPTTTPPTQLTGYSYVVTSVFGSDESQASPPAYVQSVDISAEAGSIIVTWPPVPGATSYNLYKAPAAYDAAVPVGSYYGLAASVAGTQFIDTNIEQDFTTTPPTHLNPFARSPIVQVNMVTQGTGFTQATVGYTLTTSTGADAILAPVVVGGAVVAVIVEDGGEDFAPGDTITFTGGAGATATLQLGPATGTYPAVAEYFQQRRVYADTLDQPDTVFASKTGLYTNMDQGSIPADNDAITATPWGTQVNGVQWLLAMPGGLIVATGLDAWQMTGTGGAFSPITPSSISAQSQETYGFSTIVKPIKIGYNIVYLTRFNNSVRELEYNFFANIYGGQDISFFSSHLLNQSNVVDSAWSREPNKLVWHVRADGKGVCLTYVKEQKVAGWTRYDTNGLLQSVSSTAESPVDAVYFIVKRYIAGEGVWMYYQERMDNRLWNVPEDVWAVDAGLALANPQPAATLSATAPDGSLGIATAAVVLPGQGYTNPEVLVTDPTGNGFGASIAVTIGANGALVGAEVASPGEGYGAYSVEINDPTGYGGTIVLTIDHSVTFTTDAAVFTADDVGSVIRMGGGIATVSEFQTSTSVVAEVSTPIIVTMPNDPYDMPVPAAAGSWSLTAPVNTLTNLEHLNGMMVSCVADGSVVPKQKVVNGAITLPNPATRVVVGLPFVVQAQGLHAEIAGGQTIQDKRKRISEATIRFDRSRGVTVGANQPVASILPYQQEQPWKYMATIKERTPFVAAGSAIPLFSGDAYVPIDDDPQMPNSTQAAWGMLALQQLDPMPMNVISYIAQLDFEK